MEKQTEELLEQVIVNKLTEFNNMTNTDDGDTVSSKDVNDLLKTLIENDKVKIDAVERQEKRKVEEAETKAKAEEAKLTRESEEAYKQQQLKDQRIDRYIGYVINGVSIILPLAFYGKWMKAGFKFEETGTFTSTTFRGLFGQFKPKR